jgi:ribosome-associated protein
VKNIEISERRKLAAVVKALLEKKIDDVRILDVRKLTWIADFFVIAVAETTVQARSAVESIEEMTGEAPASLEGFNSQWILLDYKDIIVHLFLPETKTFYNLEKLWADAEQINVSSLR